jgi:type II secretory pathway pseudopilin PulG
MAHLLASRKGNILIESIVSISLILIGLLGIFSLISTSIRQNKEAYLKTEGTYLAAEGLEIAKNIVDTDTVDPGFAWSDTLGTFDYGTYEVAYDSNRTTLVALGGATSTRFLDRNEETGLIGYSGGAPTPFTRTLIVSKDEASPDELQVSSVVEWQERGKPKRVTLDTIFTNWRAEDQ